MLSKISFDKSNLHLLSCPKTELLAGYYQLAVESSQTGSLG